MSKYKRCPKCDWIHPATKEQCQFCKEELKKVKPIHLNDGVAKKPQLEKMKSR